MNFRFHHMVSCAVLVFAASSPTLGQGAVHVRLGTLAPQGSSYHRILQDMGDKWRTATNGQVQTTVYAGTMGSEVELVRRMRLGQLQAATLTTTGISAIDPGIAALQEMPMMFRSLDELDYAKAKLEPVLAQRLAEKGYVVLFWADAGWVRVFSRDPVLRPDDLKKEKIFITSGETDLFDLMKSAGYQPVALEWSDVLTSLQTKMIDAVPSIPYYALATQLYTVAGHMLDLNWLPLVGGTIISKKTWDALTPQQQTAMRAIAADEGAQFQARGRAESDESVQAMVKRGLKVEPVPAAAETEWRAMSEKLYPQIRGKIVPADMFDQVVHLLAEYRAAHPRG